MESKSGSPEEIRREIENALTGDGMSDISAVEARECDTDNYSGVEITIYSDWFDVRTVIDAVADMGDVAIEELFFSNTTEEPYLGVFVAYLEEREHPAFVD